MNDFQKEISDQNALRKANIYNGFVHDQPDLQKSEALKNNPKKDNEGKKDEEEEELGEGKKHDVKVEKCDTDKEPIAKKK